MLVVTRTERASRVVSTYDHHQVPRKTDVAYTRLKELLVTLQIEPGAPIDERVLMRRLGVGRTPLREAIQRLSHEGLIDLVPRRGSWAAPLSITDVLDLIEARRLVEPPAARLAAQRIRPEHAAAIHALLDEAEDLISAGDFAGCVFLDQRFHTALAEASGNRYLARMVKQVNEQALRYWYVSFTRGAPLNPTFFHHRQLLEAVTSGQADRAEQLMHDHIDLFHDRIRDIVLRGAVTSERPSGDLYARREESATLVSPAPNAREEVEPIHGRREHIDR